MKNRGFFSSSCLRADQPFRRRTRSESTRRKNSLARDVVSDFGSVRIGTLYGVAVAAGPSRVFGRGPWIKSTGPRGVRRNRVNGSPESPVAPCFEIRFYRTEKTVSVVKTVKTFFERFIITFFHRSTGLLKRRRRVRGGLEEPKRAVGFLTVRIICPSTGVPIGVASDFQRLYTSFSLFY